MKIFFEQCLRDLHQLTGLKQYIEICNKPTKQEAETEFNSLIESMIFICNQYPYIPDSEKQKVIKSRMMDTPEFYGLNARFVKLALERVKDLYWKEQAYIETNALLSKESNAVPLEECSEETQRLVKEMTLKLASGSIQKIEPANDRELKAIQTEDELRVKKEALSKGYPIATAEELERRELHLEWIKECTDKITGKLLPGALNESDWLAYRQTKK